MEIAIFEYITCETMTKQAIIERTVEAINQLPVDKAEEISDFADFVRKRHEEQLLTEGVQGLIENSAAFDFLNNEEEIYSVDDLKEVYNG
jgi:PDZ domain-containing secreted protein